MCNTGHSVKYISFHSLGVGQDPQLILTQAQNQGLLFQTYLST